MTSKHVLIIMILLAVAGFILVSVLPIEIEHITAYVLFLTLLAVLEYSWETRKLRVQSEAQTALTIEHMELSLKPHLEIVFQRAYFRLHNIGYGPAVQVRIDDKIVSPAGYPVRLRFLCPSIIKKDECSPIEVKFFREDGKFEDESMRVECLMPPEAIETFDLIIKYENLNGKLYEHELKIGKDMYVDGEPADYLLQYLYDKFPKVINPNEIPELYVKPKDRMKLIQYCLGKGFIEAGSIKEHDRVVEFANLVITSEGIDYLKGRK